MYGLIGHKTDSETSDVMKFIAGFSPETLAKRGARPINILFKSQSLTQNDIIRI